MKKLLIGLCVLIFLVGSSFLLRGRLHSVALAGGTNNGEPDEEEQQAKCSPTNLSVGYVDNDVPDGHTGCFFPTPFGGNPGTCAGTPGTCTGTVTCVPNPANPANPLCTTTPDANGCIFLGATGPNGDWDAGVIKIDNPQTGPGALPLVVQNVTVDIGASTTGLWGTFFPISIPPGGTLILTQIGKLFNFDTSDFPLGGSEAPPLCTPDGFVPLIHVTVGTGTTQITRTFADTGQVLNTGGFDLGRCTPGGANEGHTYVELTESQNTCQCQKDSDENGDDNGQNGGEGNGNDN